MIVNSFIRRIAGMGALGLGLMGVLLSAHLINQIQKTALRLEREVPQNLSDVEQIARSIRQQGEATRVLLQTARQRVEYLGNTIDNLSQRLNQRSSTTATLNSLDEDIGVQLDNAREFVLSMQQSMRNLGGTLHLFDSMSFISPSGDSESRQDNPLRSVAANLMQTADLLDQVTAAISRLQTGQAVAPDQLNRIQVTLDQVDQELILILNEVATFSEQVRDTETKIITLKEKSPAWVQHTAQAAVLFLVCFGGSQLALLLHGVHLLRRRANPAAAEDSRLLGAD